MRFLLLSIYFISTCCFSFPQEFKPESKNSGPKLEFRVNSAVSLHLPFTELENCLVLKTDVLSIFMRNRGTVNMETLTSQDLGFPEANMAEWPKFVMGIEDIRSKDEYGIELLKAKDVFKSEYKPAKIETFKLKDGIGYVSFGPEISVIYYFEKKHEEFITIINIKGFSEQDIKELIIGGLL